MGEVHHNELVRMEVALSIRNPTIKKALFNNCDITHASLLKRKYCAPSSPLPVSCGAAGKEGYDAPRVPRLAWAKPAAARYVLHQASPGPSRMTCIIKESASSGQPTSPSTARCAPLPHGSRPACHPGSAPSRVRLPQQPPRP